MEHYDLLKALDKNLIDRELIGKALNAPFNQFVVLPAFLSVIQKRIALPHTAYRGFALVVNVLFVS
jgi:hypothetical protein